MNQGFSSWFCLIMNNMDFNKIPSPCYVMDESLFRKNLELIRSVKEKAGIDIILAFKGFAMWSAFPIVREYINGATASSVFEALLAFEEMKVKPHVYAPAYSQDDIERLIPISSHISFNSLSQYHKYEKQIRESKQGISLGIRVNPGFSEVETDLYNPTAPGTRLGIGQDKILSNIPDHIEGLHFHSLCESSAEDLEKTLRVLEQKYAPLLKKVKWVNMGGGHLMTRKGYNIDLLIQILIDFRARWNVDVILEPGSAFAWETGYLVSTIVDIVEDSGIKTAILDVSFTAHMPDCLEMPYKPKIHGATDEQDGKPTYRMGGNSCLAGDFMGNWSFDNELKPGDKIIFNDMIHYTMVKTSMFNGVQHPSIGIWNTQQEFELKRKFEYNDYKARLS